MHLKIFVPNKYSKIFWFVLDSVVAVWIKFSAWENAKFASLGMTMRKRNFDSWNSPIRRQTI